MTGVPVQRRSATEYGDDGIVRLGWPRCENRDVEKLQILVADMMETQDRILLTPCKWVFSTGNQVSPKGGPEARGSLQVELQPLDTCQTLKMKAYHSLKGSIEAMDVYSHRGEIKIDEREISERLGISRTPVREALILLEHEGFVRAVPHRGIVVLRKTRQEIIDLIIAWASLESMASRRSASRRSS